MIIVCLQQGIPRPAIVSVWSQEEHDQLSSYTANQSLDPGHLLHWMTGCRSWWGWKRTQVWMSQRLQGGMPSSRAAAGKLAQTFIQGTILCVCVSWCKHLSDASDAFRSERQLGFYLCWRYVLRTNHPQRGACWIILIHIE